jgi:hypothetical protein
MFWQDAMKRRENMTKNITFFLPLLHGKVDLVSFLKPNRSRLMSKKKSFSHAAQSNALTSVQLRLKI